ncbi:MAG: SMP-30/gluconolactonase/LRE family protein [Candidatus Cloacimonetes bacterium]|nr:SMP-30/gluconolactonase/LRE family protein [Candidatus Cloacimonadota bacterium]
MKKVILFFLFITYSLILHADYKLEKQWETDKILKTPESVIYDQENDILYVSNINGKPSQKNGKGFISKVGLGGKIIELKWITGLNAPKGSAIFNGKLYIADIDQLVEIDIKKGKILKKHKAKGAIFLNDVAVDNSGNVYVSDMYSQNSCIYKFDRKDISVWLKGKDISSPNGLFAEEDRLIVGNSGDGKLKAINFEDKSTSIVVDIGSSIDGIAKDEIGNYIISDWMGKTSLIDKNGSVIELLNTTASGINSADLTYIKNKNLVLIPTFSDNCIVAYKLIMEMN